MLWHQRRPKAPGLYSQEQSQESEESDYPFYSTLVRSRVDPMSSSGLPQYKKEIEKMQKAQQRAMKMVEGWSAYPMQKAEGTGLVQPGEQIALGTLSSFASTYRKIIKKLEPGY